MLTNSSKPLSEMRIGFFVIMLFPLYFLFSCGDRFPTRKARTVIPFDSTKLCSPQFEVDLNSIHMQSIDDFIQCQEGGVLMAGRSDKEDTLDEELRDLFLVKLDKAGRLQFKTLIELHGIGMNTLMEYYNGGFMASATKHYEEKNEYGEVVWRDDKHIIKFNEEGKMLWKANCGDMGYEPRNLLELNDQSIFVYGDEKESISYGLKNVFISLVSKDGKITEEKRMQYDLERICYEAVRQPGGAYFRIETGEEWDGRRRGEKAVKVVKCDNSGKRLWEKLIRQQGVKGDWQRRVLPGGGEKVAADTGGVMIAWNDFGDFVKLEAGNSLVIQDIKLIRVKRQTEDCFNCSYNMSGYCELYDLKKSEKGWRMAGMSGVQTVSGGSTFRFCGGGATYTFNGPKKYFIAELDGQCKILEVKSFYEGDKVEKVKLTDDGIIFLADGKLVKAVWN